MYFILVDELDYVNWGFSEDGIDTGGAASSLAF